jgi:hypothetical protein
LNGYLDTAAGDTFGAGVGDGGAGGAGDVGAVAGAGFVGAFAADVGSLDCCYFHFRLRTPDDGCCYSLDFDQKAVVGEAGVGSKALLVACQALK